MRPLGDGPTGINSFRPLSPSTARREAKQEGSTGIGGTEGVRLPAEETLSNRIGKLVSNLPPLLLVISNESLIVEPVRFGRDFGHVLRKDKELRQGL